MVWKWVNDTNFFLNIFSCPNCELGACMGPIFIVTS